jgi:RimJ/RimL family protein N-acetyltransferase
VDPNVIIEGELVALHGIGRLDVNEFLDLRQRNESFWAPFQPPSAATLLPETQPQLMEILFRMWNDQASFLFGVVDKNDALVGLAGLEHAIWARARLSCEIGFEIDRDHLRLGYASDAARLALGVAFNDGHPELCASIAARHAAHARATLEAAVGRLLVGDGRIR